MLEISALGSVCELEDLAESPRIPTLDGRDLADNRTVPEDGNFPRWKIRSLGTVASSKAIQRERQELLESGAMVIYATEFADLSDGRRVILKDDRGWTDWARESQESPWKIASGREMTRSTILTLDPDEDDWEWLEWVVERLLQLGFEVDPISVHAAPYRVEFGPLLQHELRQRKIDR